MKPQTEAEDEDEAAARANLSLKFLFQFLFRRIMYYRVPARNTDAEAAPYFPDSQKPLG